MKALFVVCQAWRDATGATRRMVRTRELKCRLCSLFLPDTGGLPFEAGKGSFWDVSAARFLELVLDHVALGFDDDVRVEVLEDQQAVDFILAQVLVQQVFANSCLEGNIFRRRDGGIGKIL